MKLSGREMLIEIYGTDMLKGKHVHHIDFNRSNNDISNLEILTPKEHSARHHKSFYKRPEGVLPTLIFNMPRNLNKAIKQMALDHDITMRQVILDALNNWVTIEGGEK